MAKVKLSYNNKEKTILAHFTNGRIDRKSTRRIHFGYFEGDQDNKKLKDRKMLVAETTDMSYVGQNYGPLASTMQQNCKYYVGVLDKTTGKMKICDAEIFQMHPKPSDIDDEVETFSLPSTVTEKTYVEKCSRSFLVSRMKVTEEFRKFMRRAAEKTRAGIGHD